MLNDKNVYAAIPSGVRLRHTLGRQQKPITGIAWSPDGSALAVPSFGKAIELWDVMTEELRCILEGHTSWVYGVAWSSDGRMLASGSEDNTVRLWDTTTGDLYRTLQGHTDSVYRVAWSPDGRTLVSSSKDKTIRLWDVNTGSLHHVFENHAYWVFSLAWSPDGRYIASGDSGGVTMLLDLMTDAVWQRLEGHADSILSLMWSPDGQRLASCSLDGTVRTWDDPGTGQRPSILEGHTGRVTSIAFSSDGYLLASKSSDGTVRLWRCAPWYTVAVLLESSAGNYWSGLAFHPEVPVLATLGDTDRTIRIWDLDVSALLGAAPAIPTVHYLNAKAVLVGKSGVGKSGLGIRIGEDEFRPTESTHGAQFWQIPVPETILERVRGKEETSSAGLPDIHAEVTLWDLAGQPEYRLVHQLFLDDTDVALLLFDCSDAADPFQGVLYWAKVLRKQTPLGTPKFLVAARTDVSPVTVDQYQINRMLVEFGLDGYIRTSAKTGRGVEELKNLVLESIPWDRLPYTTTPRLFQIIRGYLLDRKQAGDTLVRMADVRRETSLRYTEPMDVQAEIDHLVAPLHSVRRAKHDEPFEALVGRVLEQIPWDRLMIVKGSRLSHVIREFMLDHSEPDRLSMSMDRIRHEIRWRYVDQKDVGTVVRLLQARGVIYRLDLSPQRSLVLLQPERINQYASSIIQAARTHERGIGAILERDVLTASFPISGFERLEPEEEKIILESTVELLIQRDLCFREMGLLVFPSQINVTRPVAPEEHPSTEVAYRFSGSLEAIYASLVVRLSYTDHFHLEDQWKYAVEFSREGHRLGFSMQHVEEGTGELEVYFGPGITEFDRVTFIRFITDHLRTKGIEIEERIPLYCPQCGEEVKDQEAIERRVQAGKLDIPCQYCGADTIIPDSIEALYGRDRAYPEKQRDLTRAVEQRTRREVREFKRHRERHIRMEQDELIHILHLSDLHMGTREQARKYLIQLEMDLRREFKLNRLEYLIISGDVGDYSTPEEYRAAFELIDNLVKRFGLDASRVVVVPGNHDLNWDLAEEAYPFVSKRKLSDVLPEGRYVAAGDVGALVRNDNLYRRRFANFSTHFYRRVYSGSEYPADPAEQGILYLRSEDRLLFLALNSAWEIDHHFRKRASINMAALSHALGRLQDYMYDDWLKIAVWHHPVAGPDMMNDEFLQLLAVRGFKICIHGHIHRARQGFYTYDTERGLHIIGAGTFGAPAKDQVAGIPLQYNLLKLEEEAHVITVETRKKEMPNGAWSADARWGDKNNPVPRYTIELE